MNVVIMAACLVIGAVAGWGITLRRVSEEISRVQEKVDYWQDEATKARYEGRRLAQESATYAAGCKQGREDLISLMPLLMKIYKRSTYDHDPSSIDSHSRLNRPLGPGAKNDI